MVMVRWKQRVIALVVVLISGITLCSWALLANFLPSEVDPDIMKAECPGGKEWDGPGSSCHDGIIVDYVLPPIPLTAIEKSQRVVQKKKRIR
jgi:hypothetical protein